MDETWRADLVRWREPFSAGLSHRARRAMLPLYVAGLIGPGDRKSVPPMAARDEAVSYDRLHHFIAAGLWDSTPLVATLPREAGRLVGGTEAAGPRDRPERSRPSGNKDPPLTDLW